MWDLSAGNQAALSSNLCRGCDQSFKCINSFIQNKYLNHIAGLSGTIPLVNLIVFENKTCD